MPFRVWLIVLAICCAQNTALAHGKRGHENLRVIEADHHALDHGMKTFAKGLGVKCSACHVKGKYEADDVPAKDAARKFFEAVIGEHDEAKKKAALASLLAALKLDAAKDEAAIWSAISKWKRKPGSGAATK